MDANESNLFINEFLMGLTAQQYVNQGLVIQLLADIRKVNRNSGSDNND